MGTHQELAPADEAAAKRSRMEAFGEETSRGDLIVAPAEDYYLQAARAGKSDEEASICSHVTLAHNLTGEIRQGTAMTANAFKTRCVTTTGLNVMWRD